MLFSYYFLKITKTDDIFFDYVDPHFLFDNACFTQKKTLHISPMLFSYYLKKFDESKKTQSNLNTFFLLYTQEALALKYSLTALIYTLHTSLSVTNLTLVYGKFGFSFLMNTHSFATTVPVSSDENGTVIFAPHPRKNETNRRAEENTH